MNNPPKLSIVEAQPPAFLSLTGKVYWTKNNLQARVDEIHADHVVVKISGQYYHCKHNGVMNGYNDVTSEEVKPEDIRGPRLS